MAFYPCVIGGGAGVVDCLANLNEQLESLGENEYLFFASSNSTPYKGEKKTLSSGAYTYNAFNESGGIIIMDCSKISFPKIGYSNTVNVVTITQRGGGWNNRIYVQDASSIASQNINDYAIKIMIIVFLPTTSSGNIGIIGTN